ncbi:hypothetical protein CBM2608_A220021 [Cupriavidus taiwanensis]|nr:hypothetical protein CBM2608_A220021 [Cupriavidus taiwanensis]
MARGGCRRRRGPADRSAAQPQISAANPARLAKAALSWQPARRVANGRGARCAGNAVAVDLSWPTVRCRHDLAPHPALPAG